MAATKQVNAILRGTELLKVLMTGSKRLEDIYPNTSLSKSTAHRLLKTLVEAGLASQDPLSRQYLIGPLFSRVLSAPNIIHSLLSLSAVEELHRLNRISGETALLLVPCDLTRMVLKEVTSKNEISLSLGEGSTMPLNVGSSGVVLLSQYSDEELEQILELIDFVPDARGNQDTKENLLDKIRQARREGMALSNGQMHPESAGIAVPVHNYQCPVALCVWGPGYRFDPLSMREEILASSRIITSNLESVFNVSSKE